MGYMLPELLILLFIFTTFCLNSVLSSFTPDELSYADHCASTVPESTPRCYSRLDTSVLGYIGYYAGGGNGIQSPRPSYDSYPPNFEPSNQIIFNAWSIKVTDEQDLFKVEGSLQLQSSISFVLNGFWSASSGRLCMVGWGDIYLKQGDRLPEVPALLKLYGLMNFTNFTSLVTGNLESLTSCREHSSYFEPISIVMHPRMIGINCKSSLASNIFDDTNMGEADQTVQRLRVEITLVLISTTLGCVFVALQLFHVKRKPDVLPSISMLMLLILTLGYLKPLMYYFESIFTFRTNHQDALIGSDGLLAIDQATLKVITAMTTVVFLLQIRLLEKTWSARSANDTFKELWDVEKKALSVYAIGALSAMVLLMNFSHEGHPVFGLSSYGAYSGLVLDSFLFPQILINMVNTSEEKSLSVWFYMGTTFLRVLPHAYDLYRTGTRTSYMVLEEPYLFASPMSGFYSTDLDFFISVTCLLFAVITFSQQKFGGCIFLPQNLELGAYEKVPKVLDV